MWRNWNSHTLLVGNGGMEVPQKIKNRTTIYDPAIPLLGIEPKALKARLPRDFFALMFIAAVVAVAKRRKQPMCPSTDEWIIKCAPSAQWTIIQPLKGNLDTHYNRDGPQGHYAN